MVPIGKRIELLKVIAHPVRIKILEELTHGVKCVSDFEDSLDISQPNVSQHLTLLRTNGIVDFFVDGRLKCYFLKEPLIPDLLEILKKQYQEEIPPPACCPVTQVVVIKKSSKEYRQEKDPPPCPSVMVDGRFIAKNDTMTYEAVKTAVTGGIGSEA